MKKSTYIKILLSATVLLAIGVFLCAGMAYPETNTQPTFSVSQKPRIYLIGDIHTHYEIQKQIINHIRTLNKESGINLIFTEGSFGYLDLSDIDIFRRISGGQKAIEEVAEKYLKSGKISADEYLRIVDGPKYEIYGIDDMRCYYEIQAYFSGRTPNQAKEESLKVNAQREKTMIDNLVREMAKRKEKSAFMTTGTFHIRNMASELTKKGFAVVMLPMQYNMIFDKDRYKNILEHNEQLKIYRENKLKLSAVNERIEWKELQGEILETAIKNAYGSGGGDGFILFKKSYRRGKYACTRDGFRTF